MPDARLVLGVLTDADVDTPLVDDGRGDEVAARALAGQLVLGVLGIAIELPDQLAVGVVRVDPAVAAGEDDLFLTAGLAVGRIRPLAVLNQFAAVDQALQERLLGVVAAFLFADAQQAGGRSVVLPENLAGAFVDLDEAGGLRRGR